MNEEMKNVVETVVEQPQAATAAVEVSKGLPCAAYVGIGAGLTLAAYGIGCLVWNKGIKPVIQKKKAEKEEDTKAEDKPEEKKEETTDNK